MGQVHMAQGGGQARVGLKSSTLSSEWIQSVSLHSGAGGCARPPPVAHPWSLYQYLYRCVPL